jgi:hypothetical protein
MLGDFGAAENEYPLEYPFGHPEIQVSSKSSPWPLKCKTQDMLPGECVGVVVDSPSGHQC